MTIIKILCIVTVIKILQFQLKSSTHTHNKTQQHHSVSTLISFVLLTNRQALSTYMHTNNHQDSSVSNIVIISTHTHTDTQQDHLISTLTSFITLANRQYSKVPFISLGPSTNELMCLKVQKYVWNQWTKKITHFAYSSYHFFSSKDLYHIMQLWFIQYIMLNRAPLLATHDFFALYTTLTLKRKHLLRVVS